MASVQRYFSDAEHFPVHIIHKHLALENIGITRHFAALKIQRVYRGYVVRKRISKWNYSATVLQKYIRRWLVLWHLPQFYQEYYDWWCNQYYDHMAARIQGLWKGYKVRKGKVPVKVLLKKRLQIEGLNKTIVAEMKTAFENLEREKMEQMDKESEEWVLYIVFKLHHHLRTYVREGIYSLHNETKLSPMETLLKVLSLKKYMKELKTQYYKEIAEKPAHNYVFKDKKMQYLEDIYRNRDRSREPKKVFVPDLCIHDKPFNALPKPIKYPYERQILYTEEYSPPQTFIKRTVDKSKHISKNDFDLFVHKKCTLEQRPPPYYLDHWTNICAQHNIPD